MIYERVLLNRTTRIDLTRPSETGGAPSTLTLITTSVPSTTMLATCRLVHQEARPVLRAAMQRFLGKDRLLADRLEGPAPRIEVDYEAIHILRYPGGLISKILMQYEELLSVPDSLSRDHYDRQIRGHMYTLENASKGETIQALQDFIETAGKSLYYQNTYIDNASRFQSPSDPLLYPELQISVRLYPENLQPSAGFEGLGMFVSDLVNLRGHDKVQTRIHMVEPPWLQSPITGMSISTLLHNAAFASDISASLFGGSADLRKRVIAGECDFRENKKDVYDRLWREGEW
jgi:hypothetical protein